MLPGRLGGLGPFHALGLALALAACGREAAPARVKLVALGEAEIVTPPVPAPVEVFRADFAAGQEDWRRATDVATSADSQSELLTLASGSEEGRAYLELGGRAGGVYRIVPAEPHTAYELVVEARDKGLVPASTGPFSAGAFALELEPELAAGAPAPPGMVGSTHHAELALGAPGWQELRATFRTGPRTHALMLALHVGLPQTVSAGALDARALVLQKCGDLAHWEELARAAVVDYARGEPAPAGWHARRFVRGTLAEESRPSILCLPGERVGFELTIPEGKPRLECGLGPWLDGLPRASNAAQRFRVLVDGRELAAREVALAAQPEDTPWSELALDLAPFAARHVRLELALDGPLPGLFGAPVVRSADPTLARTGPPLNLVLVSIDTLRADHVGAYGYAGGTTPCMDALARQGILCKSVVSQAPYTLPSHATLFSGQFPSVHGVQSGAEVLGTLRSPMLAHELDARGYATAAFTGSGYLAPRWGFDKGFERFLTRDPLRHMNRALFAARLSASPGGPAPASEKEPGAEYLRRWLADHRGEPFLLFLHTYEVHDYDPPPEGVTCRARGCTAAREDPDTYRLHPRKGRTPVPLSDAQRAHWTHRYDDALRHVDAMLGRVLDALDALGLAQNTIVAVTSDHGEELFERGFLQHGKSLYEEVTRIPMILRIPGVAPRVIETPLMQADLAPTLFAALGLPRDARMQGLDLLGPLPAARPTWTEIHDRFVHKYALRAGPLKLLHGPPDAGVFFPSPVEWELYDLARDPGEQENLAVSRAEELARLRAELEGTLGSLESVAQALGAIAPAGELPLEKQKELDGLGYGGK